MTETLKELRDTPQCDALAREHQRGGIDAKNGPGVVQDWIALAQKLERSISDEKRTRSEVAAAFIEYCKGQHIPAPGGERDRHYNEGVAACIRILEDQL